jgi:RNA polymerase sigma-70 factor (ECF subfamily)
MDRDVAVQTVAAQDDWSLARRIAAGDKVAFEHLMRRYNRRLYRLARATLRDDTEAKDALQEAYIRAYRSMGQFRGESALSTWLSRLVLNECGARRRRSARRDNIMPIVSADDVADRILGVADSNEQPDQALARAQMRDVLERKVSNLPDAFRAVFVLRSVEELSVEEVATILEIPEETVRSRHFRAKGMLREAVAREVDLAHGDIYDLGGAHCDAIVASVLSRLD